MGAVIIYDGGVAPKRKGLGKQNFEWVKGWVNENQNYSRVGYLGNKNVLSLAKLNSNVNSHVSIQYVNLDHFHQFFIRQMVSPKKVHLQTT
jgi:hypothetical protein